MAGGVITLAQQKGGSGKTTLAVNLGVALARQGARVALLDTDPQGSLGRWFMTRLERLGDPGLEFSTASAWGVSYEVDKLRRSADFVIIDTPPKVDADLRPALRAADLVVVPVAASHVDLWATEGVLDLCGREGKEALMVMNRTRSGTRLATEVAEAATGLGAKIADAGLGARVAFAETLGQGLAVTEAGASAAATEMRSLTDEVIARMKALQGV